MTKTVQRIVFLDIDGPIINTPMFYLHPGASMQRTALNTQAIAYVARLCKIANALVVFNSTHNTHDVPDPMTGDMRTIRTDMIRWGLNPNFIHTDWCTDYPQRYDGRLRPIQRWIDKQIAKNPDVDYDWVCFDDEKFTDDKRLIVIDFDKGIDYTAYRKAAKVWGFRNDPIWAGN